MAMLRTPTFAGPIPNASVGSRDFFGKSMQDAPIRFPKAVPLRPGRLVSCSAGWKDAVFGGRNGDQGEQASLAAFSSGFPTKFGTLHLLGISSCGFQTYVTFQTNERNPAARAPYAISSQAFPLPHTKAAERFLVHDAFAAMYGTQCPTGTALSPYSTAFAQELLPTELKRVLSADAIKLVDAARNILKERQTETLNRANAIHGLLGELRARVVAASVEEVPSVSTSETNVCISGFLFVERELTKLYGETIYSGKIERVRCEPVEAVAIANTTTVPCYMTRTLFEGGAELVRDMIGAFAARGEMRIHLKYNWDEDDLCPIAMPLTTDSSKLPKTWELKAEDVLNMSDDDLRRQVSASGLPTTREEDRNSLLRKLVDLMDEVERRELAIQLAASQELYGLAGEMQASRSKRGILLQELKDAEKKGLWSEVVRIGQKIRLLESQTADITAEPGSYSSYLDQDEWYKPNR